MAEPAREFYVDRIGVFADDPGAVRIVLMQTRPRPDDEGGVPSSSPVIEVGCFALSVQAATELARELTQWIARISR
jgi:hypothetical protein